MTVTESSISGVYIIDTKEISDSRGSFFRAFCRSDLSIAMGQDQILQANISKTNKTGSLRGIHFQYPPHAETKLVRCLTGSVWDVAVDLRKGSPTFLKYEAVKLDAQDAKMLVVPPGCAHGFQSLEDNVMLLYLHTAFYSPQGEGGIRYDEPLLGINWPIHPTVISERDLRFEYLPSEFEGVEL